MRLSLESLSALAAYTHNTFSTAFVIPRHVLAYRLATRQCRFQCQRKTFSRCMRHFNTANVDAVSTSDSIPPRRNFVTPKETEIKRSLPVTCPGCGALSQVNNSEVPGFFSASRKAVKSFLQPSSANSRKGDVLRVDKSDIEDGALCSQVQTENLDTSQKDSPSIRETSSSSSPPLCDRCHDLVHNARGRPFEHPTLQDIADSIAESPFKRNHVYHVLDAADFPMSLIPNVVSELTLAQPRSRNRRSQHDFSSRPTMSFIITRSDLLGPNKEMVDKMMPYFQSILRKAMGRNARSMRLGNVHLVSAKRGWWTSDIKESIWKRGGGNWMVGKVNVGKSNLFEVLFPKGSGERAPTYAELKKIEQEAAGTPLLADAEALEFTSLQENSLLPPPQAEVPFPVLPVVSSIPGTTVSPIRLSFGGRRGELIDLPGLERGALEKFVKSQYAPDLVMHHRPNVAQHVIKPGQSLVLGGGLIRITPDLDMNDFSTTMLAYPFVPLDVHVTSTQKAESMQRQERQSGITTILKEGAGSRMHSAGIFALDHDITKARSGPLLRAGVSFERLPFRVYSTDLLIEGVGWVELVCQVRKRKPLSPGTVSREIGLTTSDDETQHSAAPDSMIGDKSEFAPFSQEPETVDPETRSFHVPRVEVFSPLGRHIGNRQPLGAWVKWTEGRRNNEKASSTKRAQKRRP